MDVAEPDDLAMFFLDEAGEPVGVDVGDIFTDPRLDEWWAIRNQPGPRNRLVVQDDVGNYGVATVFTHVNLAFISGGPPVLWETTVSRKEPPASNVYRERYTSRAEAERRHADIVAALLAGRHPDELHD